MSETRKQRKQLIDELAADLDPVKNPGRILAKTMLWLTSAVIVTIVLLRARAPFRPGSGEQLLEHAQFSAESLLGAAAIAALAVAAFRTAIPGLGSHTRQLAGPIGLTAIWFGCYVYGLFDPALPPSMAGKRPHCVVEVFAYGLPALAMGLLALRALYPLHGAVSGAMMGLAAGAIPALAMQFACMYLAPHILTYHLAPAIALSALGALAGFFLLRPRIDS